jgi:hypothetical protein
LCFLYGFQPDFEGRLLCYSCAVLTELEERDV